jgi:hypothetical protein
MKCYTESTKCRSSVNHDGFSASSEKWLQLFAIVKHGQLGLQLLGDLECGVQSLQDVGQIRHMAFALVHAEQRTIIGSTVTMEYSNKPESLTTGCRLRRL